MSIAMQSRFAKALREADSVPEGVTSWNLPRPERRFDVYRNNVAYGLTRALAVRFPVAARLVGEEFFAGMARAFIAAHPPRSPLLLFYGDELADFVTAFAPAAELPYLARRDPAGGGARTAYHAADVLAARTDGALPRCRRNGMVGLVFELHPAVSVRAFRRIRW